MISEEEFKKLKNEEKSNYEEITQKLREKIEKEIEEIDFVAEKLGDKLDGKLIHLTTDENRESILEKVQEYLENAYYYS